MVEIGAALRLLTSRGFVAVKANAGARSFEGTLPCEKGAIPVKLTIVDWNFLTYPIIQLRDKPAFLPDIMPHSDVKGNLCYFSPGTVTLDRFRPDIALAQCLDQVTAILNRIAKDPSYRVKDIQNEFIAHWVYGQSTSPWQVFLGDIDSDAESAHYFTIGESDNRLSVIASDKEKAFRFANALGHSAIRSKDRCWLFQTNIVPIVPQKMPQTVKEIFDWLKIWDGNLSRDVQNVLGKPDYLEFEFVTFAVRTPVGWFGFGFELEYMMRRGYQRVPKRYRNFLHNRGGSKELIRLAIDEVGSQFVHSRNLSFKDLHNKRITVVGCGAIGSYVAQALIRLGAGTGEKGLLKLIDPETVGPENLGRHILGYPSLLKSKAVELSNELLRQFPNSKVDGHMQSAFKHQALFAADLIVDATGEEQVSEFLNDLRLRHGSKTPILHTWIRGNGEAVQALWTDGSGGGCYRCLLVPDEKYHRLERFKLLKKEPERRNLGCRAFTPYAVSAPMQAAALAIDMVAAWMAGDPSPRFRTRSVETADVFSVKNQNISKIEGCPACGQH